MYTRKKDPMQKYCQPLFPLVVLCILGATIYLTIHLITPPPPISADAPATVFSAERAMQDLAIITCEPHPMGEFPASIAVRDYLLDEIRSLNLEPQVQKTFGVRAIPPGWVIAGAVENVLVRLPGTDPEGAILLMAHYDSTPGAPGAADNGSGVVITLELLRALNAGHPLIHDVIFLFVDGEEPGTIGAHAFVNQHPWFKDVKFTINMDMFREGPPNLVRTNGENGILIQALARTSPKPAYISLPFHLFPSGDTDLLPFIQAGVPAVDILTPVLSPEVHTMLDLPNIVNPSSVQLGGDQLLGLVRYLGNQPTLDMNEPDETFFPILGRLVHYPISLAWPVGTLAGLCFLVTLFYGFRIRALTWNGLGLGFVTFILNLILGVGIANLLWMGVQALHPEYQYSSIRTRLSDDYLYAIGLSTLVFAVCMAIIATVRKKISLHDLASGVLLFWLPASITTTILIPATSYLASWGLFVGSMALLLSLYSTRKTGTPIFSWLGFLISAIIAIFLWLPVVYSAFLGSGFPLLSMMVGLVALMLGGLMPILDWLTRPKPWLLPATSLLVSLGFILAGHFLVGKDSPPPLINSIGYWFDVESNEANWIAFIGGYRMDAVTTTEQQVAFPEEMDERQKHILIDPIRRPYTEIFQEAPPFSVLTSSAPKLNKAGPHLEVVEDLRDNNRRLIRVLVTTSMHDRLYVIIPGEAEVLALTLPHNERIEVPGYDEEFVLRFDGMPSEGFEIVFEINSLNQFEILLVEEKTGLPSFPGLSTLPEPGTMRSPGEFYQGDATDFTAINRDFVVQSLDQ